MPSQELEQIIGMLGANRPTGPRTWAEQRAGFEAMAGAFALADDVRVSEVSAGGVASEWVEAPGVRANRAVLYLHGGGYVIGSPRTHRELAARISAASGLRLLVADYRLAPEHPYPAAVEDAVTAYRWLLAQQISPDRIAIAGDSAGGGLTIATMLALKAQHVDLPACAVCMSPWTDLEGTGASAQPGGANDPMIALDGLRQMGVTYAGARVREPLASPLYGNLEHLPPLLIQVGTRELLLDDATRLAERARAAGVMIDLQVAEDLVHVWQLFPNLPEAASAVREIGRFLRLHIG